MVATITGIPSLRDAWPSSMEATTLPPGELITMTLLALFGRLLLTNERNSCGVESTIWPSATTACAQWLPQPVERSSSIRRKLIGSTASARSAKPARVNAAVKTKYAFKVAVPAVLMAVYSSARLLAIRAGLCQRLDKSCLFFPAGAATSAAPVLLACRLRARDRGWQHRRAGRHPVTKTV